jgi:uncharacterized membrane protein/ribosomal protein L32
MSESYRVLYTGKVNPDKDLEEVIDSFSEKFKLERKMAEKVIKAGRPVSLKKDLDLEKAEKYLAVLERIGIEVELDPKPPMPEPEPPAPSGLELEPLDHGGGDTTEVLDPAPDLKQCPKCGSSRMEMGICQDCGIVASKFMASRAQTENEENDSGEIPSAQANPYSAPEADLVEESENEMVGPHGVPVGNSFSWLGKGWWHFKSSPLAWILTIIVWFIISIILSLIPVLGSIASILIGPVIMAGFMYGCAEQDDGGDFSISHLFSGFSNNVGQLMLVAVFYFIMMIAAVAIMMGGMFMFAGGTMALESPEAMSGIGAGTLTGMVLLVLVVMLPIMMSYIFAPALVMLDDLSAFEAMKYSFTGCLKNILPLFVFSLLAFVLMIIGSIPIGLGLLIVFPMLTASLYAAYRDIYFD